MALFPGPDRQGGDKFHKKKPGTVTYLSLTISTAIVLPKFQNPILTQSEMF